MSNRVRMYRTPLQGRVAVGILLGLGMLLWCCNGTERRLVGNWHVVKWENPYYDSFYSNAKNYIDTLGKGHDCALNMELYGTCNVDSLRQVLKGQFDSTRMVMENAVNKTELNIKKGGIIEVTYENERKEGKWLLDKDNALIIEEADFGEGEGNGITKCRIVDLGDKRLVLRFYQKSDSSTITFEQRSN